MKVYVKTKDKAEFISVENIQVNGMTLNTLLKKLDQVDLLKELVRELILKIDNSKIINQDCLLVKGVPIKEIIDISINDNIIPNQDIPLIKQGWYIVENNKIIVDENLKKKIIGL